MMRIGLIGCDGLLGSNISRILHADYDICGISRGNYQQYIGEKFDIVINANGNSRKFWANQNPSEDYKLSVLSVDRSIDDFGYNLYIYISSVDATSTSVYGVHKLAAENIVISRCTSHLILRCTTLIGRGMKKGLIYDIIAGAPKLFVHPDSRLQFITTDEVSRIIHRLINLRIINATFNITGKGNVGLEDLEGIFNIQLRPKCDGKEIVVYTDDCNRIAAYYPIKTSRDYILEYLRQVDDERMVKPVEPIQ